MIKRRPYLLFFFTTLLLFTGVFFSENEITLDINFHDTYFVTREKDVFIIFSLFTAALGLLYLLGDVFKFQMNTRLSKIHLFGTLFSLLLFGIFFKLQNIFNSETYYTVTNYPADYSLYLLLILLLLVLLQILFIINIFVAIINTLRTFNK